MKITKLLNLGSRIYILMYVHPVVYVCACALHVLCTCIKAYPHVSIYYILIHVPHVSLSHMVRMNAFAYIYVYIYTYVCTSSFLKNPLISFISVSAKPCTDRPWI